MNDRLLRRSIRKSAREALRYALIAIVFVAGPLWTVNAQAQITDTQVAAFVEALRLSAPNTGIKNDGLFSDWKIKEDNIVRWSKRCTGTVMTPAEFEANTQKAREIIGCIMGKILREQYEISRVESIAIRRAASWWMTGDPAQYDSPQAKIYTEKVLSFYKKAP
ncbi:MAG: hypothetical protein ABSG91_09740 [Syntrophobacteraceae bacterium]|jgi:hypothetical protein